MNLNEVINNVKAYVDNAIENLEYGMNIIECNDELNNGQNDEMDNIYQKLSSAIKILEDI
ncbi:MAG: hypothetical protein ACLR60_11840 [Clostridium paraputrificum]